MGWLAFLGYFGLLGVMFMAGFEVDPALLRKTWRASLTIGLASILVPLWGVYAVSRFAFGLDERAAALLGVGLSTTSLPLVYQFLRERNVLAMTLLASLLGHLGWATAIFLIAAVPAVWSLPRLCRLLVVRYRGSAVESEIRFLLLVLSGSAPSGIRRHPRGRIELRGRPRDGGGRRGARGRRREAQGDRRPSGSSSSW